MAKKIIVFTGFYSPYVGGLSSHAKEFDRLLSQDGFDITVFTSQLPRSAPQQEIVNARLRIIRFPAFEIVPNYPLPRFWKWSFWKAYRGLFKEPFDLVISRIRFFNTSLLAAALARRNKLPWIHIEHTSNFTILSSRFKSKVAKAYDQTFGQWIFRHSDLNVSISEAVRKFVNRFDPRHSPVIYRGLDLPEIDAIPEDFSLRKKFPSKLIIATAARLYKWKGIDLTIAALKDLPLEIKNRIIFLVIGDGEDLQRLQAQADKSVIFLGRLSRSRTISVLKATDIYIHSSRPGGGLSTSLLEAMYCGLPVIATPNEGADEVIVSGQNGFLVSHPYSSGIQNALIELVKDEKLSQKLGKEAHRSISLKFDWTRSIGEYRKMIEHLLCGK